MSQREDAPGLEPISIDAPPLSGRAVASQRWSELAFLHWRVDSELIAPLLPAGVRPDEFDGSSWVGLIGFVLDRATVLGSPPVPYFGDFVEVNVRLYGVDEQGRRGVVFVSLEASRLAAVLAARALFSLPYIWSRTAIERPSAAGDELRYRSVRHRDSTAHTLIAIVPGERRVQDDALADFLTARWALFSRRGAKTLYLRNTHEAWPLYEATLVHLDDTLVAAAGLPGVTDRAPDSVLYSPGVTTWFGTG
jgi:uncharacterized protein YqjF (DUF2071 family)